MLPEARKNRVVVETMGNEVLVYDLDTHKAHCLNPVAASVWGRLDGQATVAGLVQDLKLEERAVLLSLRQLDEARLLSGPLPKSIGTVNRRDMLKTMGKIAAMAPIVASITAPTAAHAASCIATNNQGGKVCTSNGQCCSGNCNKGRGLCFNVP